MDKEAAKRARIQKEFGENLERLIAEKFPSRDAFLKKSDLEMYKANLHRIIKGQDEPKLTTLYKIAEALDISVRELFPGTYPENS